MARLPPPAPPTQPHSSSGAVQDRRLRAAFSLVETLVVLTIVGLVAGLAIPPMSRMLNQSRVQRATQSLQSNVGQAFAIAGRNRAPVTIRWNGTAGELRVTNLNGSLIYRRVSMNGFGIAGSEVTMTPTTLTVFPNGIANDSLVIAVSKRGYTRTVRMSRSGMIRSR